MTRTAVGAVLALASFGALAQEVVFDDPKGDDYGPGSYTYPTERVYKRGSFDLTELRVTQQGDKVTFQVSVNSDLEDPWAMGAGFSVQMIFVHVKTGPGGFTEGIPGTNVSFAPDSLWNKVVILSPQKPSVVKMEVKKKCDPQMRGAVLAPETRGKGRVISATVDKKDLGDGDIASWGYQALMQSNEGFPDMNDVLTRKVNEVNGAHRFGGGSDWDCDPHVIDILGTPEQQKEWLSYECGANGSSVKRATLHMVWKR